MVTRCILCGVTAPLSITATLTPNEGLCHRCHYSATGEQRVRLILPEDAELKRCIGTTAQTMFFHYFVYYCIMGIALALFARWKS